jgi:hypothetical protein
LSLFLSLSFFFFPILLRAFAATAHIESRYLMNNSAVFPLAPQQMVDCDTGSFGCAGGNSVTAWSYVYKTGGQESESAYPYVRLFLCFARSISPPSPSRFVFRCLLQVGRARTCSFNANMVKAKVDSASYFTVANNIQAIAQALTTIGPLVSFLFFVPAFLAHCCGFAESVDGLLLLVSIQGRRSQGRLPQLPIQKPRGSDRRLRHRPELPHCKPPSLGFFL